MSFSIFDDYKFTSIFARSLFVNAVNPVFLIDLASVNVLAVNEKGKAFSEAVTTPQLNFSDLFSNTLQWLEVKKHLSPNKAYICKASLFNTTPVQCFFHLIDDIVCCICFDLTESYKQINENKLYKQIFDNASEAVMITDKNKNIIDVNYAFETITGYSQSEVLGLTPNILSSNIHNRAFYESMWNNIIQNGEWEGEIWNRRKNGELYLEWLTINCIYDESDQLKYYVALFSDLTKKKEQEEKLKQQAYYDSLTNLPNRLFFYKKLVSALEKAKNEKSKVGLFFIDLDHFNQINDFYGHFIGDNVLKTISTRLKKILGPEDSLARFGGDEFVLVSHLSLKSPSVDKIAQEILNIIKKPLLIDGKEIDLTASIGLATFPDDSITLEELVSIADHTLHATKQAHVDHYQKYSKELGKLIQRKISIKKALNFAIKNNEFYPVYQAVVDCKTQEIQKFEVLARWHSSLLNETIRPDEFIPIAEENSLIYQIGEQITKQAFTDITDINSKLNSKLGIALNRSTKELDPQNYIVSKNLETLVEQYKFPVELLTIEITESSLINDHSPQIESLNYWRNCGATIAIDDFGTGFSALSYLTKFPIDVVKVDKSFISKIESSEDSRHLVDAIIKLTQTLQLETIIEGVETEEQYQFVKACGASYIQGYYFSKPLLKDQALEFAKSNLQSHK